MEANIAFLRREAESVQAKERVERLRQYGFSRYRHVRSPFSVSDPTSSSHIPTEKFLESLLTLDQIRQNRPNRKDYSCILQALSEVWRLSKSVSSLSGSDNRFAHFKKDIQQILSIHSNRAHDWGILYNSLIVGEEPSSQRIYLIFCLIGIGQYYDAAMEMKFLVDTSETSTVIRRIFELYNTDRKIFAGKTGAFHCYKDLPQMWWLIKFASSASNLDQVSPPPLSIAYLPESVNRLIRERESLFESNDVQRALFLLKEFSLPTCDRSVYFMKLYVFVLFLSRRLFLSTQILFQRAHYHSASLYYSFVLWILIRLRSDTHLEYSESAFRVNRTMLTNFMNAWISSIIHNFAVCRLHLSGRNSSKNQPCLVEKMASMSYLEFREYIFGLAMSDLINLPNIFSDDFMVQLRKALLLQQIHRFGEDADLLQRLSSNRALDEYSNVNIPQSNFSIFSIGESRSNNLDRTNWKSYFDLFLNFANLTRKKLTCH